MGKKTINKYLGSADASYIENLFKRYQQDPGSLDQSWQRFFEGFEWGRASRFSDESYSSLSQKEFKVINLIDSYRRRGHLFSPTNPVRSRRHYSPDLDIKHFGLGNDDLAQVFQAGHEIGIGAASLQDIINHLEETYCRSIGVEYRYIRQPEKLKWLQQRMESIRNRPDFPVEFKRQILSKLNSVVVFEKFLHSRFVGQKRFALSGGETIVPGLDALIGRGSELGVRDFVIGMPHRGRINILTNILAKPREDIFAEFEGKNYSEDISVGDVKYHLGYTNAISTSRGEKVTISIVPNPSHLEAVDPYVQGVSRLKIDQKHKGNLDKLVPILIHGDAAIAGQGLVYEVIQMSLLPGYRTGGTIHLVINNQLGFTTNYLDGRSSTYCTDVAKVTLSPVFHVNADDVEAVILAMIMAMEYRQRFHTDVFIDLLGYRKYGHNESDEPRFTQPKLYKTIADHPNPREIYAEKLKHEGIIEEAEVGKMEKSYWSQLQSCLDRVKAGNMDTQQSAVPMDDCERLKRTREIDFESSPATALKKELFLDIGRKIFEIPEDIDVFSKIRLIYNTRKKKLLENKTCDWAMGEALAYASLLHEKVNVRLSGQDSIRGTFSHRHAVLLAEDGETEIIPLNRIDPRQGRFQIFNSPLSEYGILGFEFGYACANPRNLVIWEAQFGDFANGAQIIIDEYIASSEAKWGRLNSLVLLLPHGHEGQGPDHSSARLERFLEICARKNLVISNCTTPANFFHLIRRHMKWPFRVPLVTFTPKSLLRHPGCVSKISDFCSGKFQPLIDDSDIKPERVRKVLFCSGKIFYELLTYIKANKIDDTAIVRIEQLYPFPIRAFKSVLSKYGRASQTVWVQEEPENMGAWPFLIRTLNQYPLGLVARLENATAATGFYQVHVAEQKKLVAAAFSDSSKGLKDIVVRSPQVVKSETVIKGEA